MNSLQSEIKGKLSEESGVKNAMKNKILKKTWIEWHKIFALLLAAADVFHDAFAEFRHNSNKYSHGSQLSYEYKSALY